MKNLQQDNKPTIDVEKWVGHVMGRYRSGLHFLSKSLQFKLILLFDPLEIKHNPNQPIYLLPPLE